MDINFEKGTVILFGKSTKLETLIKKFTQLSGEQVYHFLINRGIQLPRRINCMALISVLNKRIKKLNSNSLSKDYFTRLQYYKSFSEQQLFSLFTKICNDDNAFDEYRYNLFELILTNFVALDLNDGELVYVKNLKKQTTEPFPQYFNYVSGACLEQTTTFDGQDVEVLKETLVNSASNQEIFDIAGKYGIDLPQRLKKEEYEEFIYDYMQKNGTYNDEIAEELKQMNITQLTTFCNRVNIPMHPNMNKDEMVLYLFYFLDKCTMDYTSVKRIETPKKYEPLEFTVNLRVVSNFGRVEAQKVIFYDESQDSDEEDVNLALNPTDEDVVDESVKEQYQKEQEEALALKEAKKKKPSDLEILEEAKKEEESTDPVVFERQEPAPGIVEEDTDKLDSSFIKTDEDENEEASLEESLIQEENSGEAIEANDSNESEESLEDQLAKASEEAYYEEDPQEYMVYDDEGNETIIYVDENNNIIDPSRISEDGHLIEEEPAEPVEEEPQFDVTKITVNDEYNSKKIQAVGKSKGPLIAYCTVFGIIGIVLIYLLFAFLL